jgi:hypothetical protein
MVVMQELANIRSKFKVGVFNFYSVETEIVTKEKIIHFNKLK